MQMRIGYSDKEVATVQRELKPYINKIAAFDPNNASDQQIKDYEIDTQELFTECLQRLAKTNIDAFKVAQIISEDTSLTKLFDQAEYATPAAFSSDSFSAHWTLAKEMNLSKMTPKQLIDKIRDQIDGIADNYEVDSSFQEDEATRGVIKYISVCSKMLDFLERDLDKASKLHVASLALEHQLQQEHYDGNNYNLTFIEGLDYCSEHDTEKFQEFKIRGYIRECLEEIKNLKEVIDDPRRMQELVDMNIVISKYCAENDGKLSSKMEDEYEYYNKIIDDTFRMHTENLQFSAGTDLEQFKLDAKLLVAILDQQTGSENIRRPYAASLEEIKNVLRRHTDGYSAASTASVTPDASSPVSRVPSPVILR
jgi:hypothetical protein